jgi:hypothetical protein
LKKPEVQRVLDGILEELAAIEHQRWCHWQRYVHDRGQRLPDGSLVLSRELVQRWDIQISKAYADLDESEKESDREQVRKYLPVIASALSSSD